MRKDMYKVIVERPRRGKERDSLACQLRGDLDGPPRLGMRAGYGYRELNENLAPLRRYLHTQVGRPWGKVFSEICARIGPALRERGLIFVGIDVIDGWLTEINVTSPTGIRAVKNLGGPDVAAMIWDNIEAKRKQ